MPPIRVLLVDDEEMFAETLALRLSEVGGVVVAGRLRASQPWLAYDVASLAPDVVLIDPEPLGGNAQAVLAAILDSWPSGKIVALTGGRDVSLAVAVARAGGVGWVSKDRNIDELLDVVRGVYRGEAWYTPAYLGAVLRALRADAARQRNRVRPGELLSHRELEVLAGVVAGQTDGEIADDLGIAVKTVRTHTATLRAKLGVRSRRGLIEAAEGYVSHSPPARGSTRANDVVRLMHKDEPPGPAAT